MNNRMKAIGIFTGIIGVCLVLAGLGIYFFKTERIDVNTNPPIKAQFYSESGQNFWGGWDYSVYEFLDPTDLIKLNTKYLVIVKVPRGADITLFKTEHVVSWNQSQLNNENGEILSTSRSTTSYAGTRQKTFIKRISEKQFNLIHNAPITTAIYELQPHHDVRYIIPGIFVVVLGVVLFLLAVINSRKRTENRPPTSSP